VRLFGLARPAEAAFSRSVEKRGLTVDGLAAYYSSMVTGGSKRREEFITDAAQSLSGIAHIVSMECPRVRSKISLRRLTG
jgi:hypothetical protein